MIWYDPAMRLFYRNGWAYLYINRKKTIALHTKDTIKAEATKAEFEERLLAAKLDVVRGKTSAGTITISGLSEKYCARLKTKTGKPLSPESIKKDKLVLRLFAEAVDDIPIRTITEDTIDEFDAACRSRKMTADGIASYLRHLKAALRWAASPRQKLMDRAPQIVVPSDESDKPLEFRLVSEASIDKLIKKAHENFGREFGILIETYARTGCRRREGLGLLAEKTSLTKKKAHADVLGKRSKWRRLYVPKKLKANLKSIMPEKGRVFPDWHPDTVSHWFGECADALKLSCRLHDLRHTWITRLLEKGVPVHIVQRLAGHTKLSTTMRYVHLREEIIAREIAEKVLD